MKKTILLILMILLFVFVISELTAEDFDYRKAMLKQYEVGAVFTIWGEVLQIFSSTDTLIMSWTLDRVIWVHSENPFALDGDIVKFVAEYQGLTTYETAGYGLNTVPVVKFVQLIQN